MKHAWDGYVKYAWGTNEVRPISLRGHSASIFGSASMGATVVDAMDTLYIMGFMDEFEKGREWIEQSLDFNHMVSLIFCTVILCSEQKKTHILVSYYKYGCIV